MDLAPSRLDEGLWRAERDSMRKQRLIGSWTRLIGNQKRHRKVGALKGEIPPHREARISEAIVDHLQGERLTLQRRRLLWEAHYSSLLILYGRLDKRRCSKRWRNSSKKGKETQASRNGCAMLSRHKHGRDLPKVAPAQRMRRSCLRLVVDHHLLGAAAAVGLPWTQELGLRFHEDHHLPYLRELQAEIAPFHDGSSRQRRRPWCRMQDQG